MLRDIILIHFEIIHAIVLCFCGVFLGFTQLNKIEKHFTLVVLLVAGLVIVPNLLMILFINIRTLSQYKTYQGIQSNDFALTCIITNDFNVYVDWNTP